MIACIHEISVQKLPLFKHHIIYNLLTQQIKHGTVRQPHSSCDLGHPAWLTLTCWQVTGRKRPCLILIGSLRLRSWQSYNLRCWWHPGDPIPGRQAPRRQAKTWRSLLVRPCICCWRWQARLNHALIRQRFGCAPIGLTAKSVRVVIVIALRRQITMHCNLMAQNHTILTPVGRQHLRGISHFAEGSLHAHHAKARLCARGHLKSFDTPGFRGGRIKIFYNFEWLRFPLCVQQSAILHLFDLRNEIYIVFYIFHFQKYTNSCDSFK